MELIAQLLALLNVSQRLEYNVLEKKIQALEAAHAASFCHSCGRPDPVFVSGTEETACCQDEVEASKEAVLANLKQVQQDLLDKALDHPRAQYIV